MRVTSRVLVHGEMDSVEAVSVRADYGTHLHAAWRQDRLAYEDDSGWVNSRTGRSGRPRQHAVEH